MEIQYSGLRILCSPAELSDILHMVCNCGHQLRDHAYFTLTKYKENEVEEIQVTTKGCRECGKPGDTFVCNQFMV